MATYICEWEGNRSHVLEAPDELHAKETYKQVLGVIHTQHDRLIKIGPTDDPVTWPLPEPTVEDTLPVSMPVGLMTDEQVRNLAVAIGNRLGVNLAPPSPPVTAAKTEPPAPSPPPPPAEPPKPTDPTLANMGITGATAAVLTAEKLTSRSKIVAFATANNGLKIIRGLGARGEAEVLEAVKRAN